MHLYLVRNGHSKKLPRLIHEYMRRRFGVLPEYLDSLRCFEFESTVNDKAVMRYRIYSPTKARQHGVNIDDLSDLEKNPGMLLYEGYIDREGKAYVADRRKSLRIK